MSRLPLPNPSIQDLFFGLPHSTTTRCSRLGFGEPLLGSWFRATTLLDPYLSIPHVVQDFRNDDPVPVGATWDPGLDPKARLTSRSSIMRIRLQKQSQLQRHTKKVNAPKCLPSNYNNNKSRATMDPSMDDHPLPRGTDRNHDATRTSTTTSITPPRPTLPSRAITTNTKGV
jgi:hypothetical protein